MSKKKYDSRTISIFPEGFSMELPDGYRIDTEYDDDFNENYHLRGGFYINDDGNEDFAFTGSFLTLNVDLKINENADPQVARNLRNPAHPDFAFNQVMEGVKGNLEAQHGEGKYIKLFNSLPVSTIMKFYQPFTIFGVTMDTYLVFYWVEVNENTVFGFTSVYRNNPGEVGDYHKHLLNVIKSVRVNGKAVDTGKLTPKKLEKALDLDANEDAESLDLGLSIGINFKNGDEETNYTLNSDGSVSEEKVNTGLEYASPKEELYPHYNSMLRSQGFGMLGMLGVNVVVNQTGTEYKFYNLEDDLDEDASDEMRDAVSQLNDTGASKYKLADRAKEMMPVFHVSPEVFDTAHDRECELQEGMMHRAYMMSALRSFAWTMAKYCDALKKKPADLSLGQIHNIIDTIADANWLNYDNKSVCKGLCGTQDLHVYYLPDKTPESVKAVFLPSQEDINQTKQIQEKFPNYNPILSQIGSLDKLRKDLEYIHPAIEKIYEDLKASRNYNEALIGNDADILYAWCALAYAARGPFFSEDGPTSCWFSQPVSEEERRAASEKERKELCEKWLEKNSKYLEKNPHIEFSGKKFVFTGLAYRHYSMGDETDYHKLIEDRGGLTRRNVSGVTDYLVVEPAGAGESKIQAMLENQKNGKPAKIILIDDLRKALGLHDVETVTTVAAPEQSVQNTVPAEDTARVTEETVIVDDTWAILVPDGFKYSTDKNIIGNHRNIIIMEDKPDNDFEDPFGASISFTSMFNESENENMDGVAMAKMMVGFMGVKNNEVVKDDQDLYVSYYYEPDRSYKEAGEKLDVHHIKVGTVKGVSSIQVFFSNSPLLRREQTKLVEKVAKSIKLVGEATRFSTSPGLTAEEREAIQDAQKALDDIGKALDDIRDHWKATESERLGLMAYFDKMEEREKKEKAERKKNKKKAAAAGKSDADIVNMYVVLCNEEKAKTKGMTSSKFYKLYEDFFPAFTKDELWNARKDMLAKMQDNDLCKEYAESFRKRSIQDRFNIATKSYFTMEMDSFRDSTLCSEDAIDNTSDWFVADEMPAVKQLMNNELIKQNNRITEQFSWAEPEWMKYSKAKDYLEIQISDYNERKELVSDECKMFQVKLDKFGGPFLVAAVLRQKSYMPLVVNVMDACTHYWGVSQSEVWEAAFSNNVRNSSDASFDERQYAKEAMWIAKTNYPDLKEIKRIRKEESEKKVGKFVRDIKRLCENEVSIKASDVKSFLKEDFSSASELAEYKAKLAEAALKEKLEFLPSILSAHEDAQELYDSLPEILTERINTAIEEKILAANEAKYNNAINLSESDDMKDINAARDIFASLGLFKDAKALEQQCVTKIDNIKTAQYDEALALRANGSEESIHKAINILTELGSFKAANEKVKEYKNELDRRRKLEEIKTLSQSESIADLNKAITMLEEFREESANAEALINHCNNKLEKIKEERYSQAISLAEEGTEASIKSAILKMDAIKPYKDSAEKAEVFREQLHNEGVYNNAVALMDSSDISDLVVAQGIFENLANYKDAADKANACETRINELSESLYQEGLAAQKVYSLKSQTEAISKFNQLGTYKDSFERKNQCNENCKTIQAIHDLNKEIEGHKKELSAITGAFKKKERQAKETLISAKEKRVNELKDKLTGKFEETERALNEQKKSEEEKLSDIDVTRADANEASMYTSINMAEETTKTNVLTNDSSKTKKRRPWILILVLFAILIAAAIYLMNSGLLSNNSAGGASISDNDITEDADAGYSNNAETKDATYATSGYGDITSGELRRALLERFDAQFNEVVDLSDSYFDEGFGELAYTIDGTTAIIRTQMQGEGYDENSPIDYCNIYTDKAGHGTEIAAIIVNELFSSFEYEDAKNDIEELLKKSEAETENESQIELEGNVYTEGSLYCAYQSTIDIIIIIPPDVDINDVLGWSNMQ